MGEETWTTWADGRPRFAGETRKGFDSATGNRTRGRPRKLSAFNGKEVYGDGLFARLIVRIMTPRLEHYILDEKVAYIEITDISTTLVLNDSSRVTV